MKINKYTNLKKCRNQTPCHSRFRRDHLRSTSRIISGSGSLGIICHAVHYSIFTAPFNNMRTLKFKAQRTNAFFATVNQIFFGSSRLPTIAERAVIKSLCTVQTAKQCSAVVVSWEDPPNIWLMAAKNAFVGWPLNFRVRMLLKSAVKSLLMWPSWKIVWIDLPSSLRHAHFCLLCLQAWKTKKHPDHIEFLLSTRTVSLINKCENLYPDYVNVFKVISSCIPIHSRRKFVSIRSGEIMFPSLKIVFGILVITF